MPDFRNRHGLVSKFANVPTSRSLRVAVRIGCTRPTSPAISETVRGGAEEGSSRPIAGGERPALPPRPHATPRSTLSNPMMPRTTLCRARGQDVIASGEDGLHRGRTDLPEVDTGSEGQYAACANPAPVPWHSVRPVWEGPNCKLLPALSGPARACEKPKT